MAEPYVQFVFNFSTKEPHGEPVFAPGGPPAPGPFYWQITSDAAGKVLVRDHTSKVIGTAVWQFNKTAERVRDRETKRLDDARWNEIDSRLFTCLRQALANGSSDPNALDPGAVTHPIGVGPKPEHQPSTGDSTGSSPSATPAPTPPAEKQSLGSKILYSILGIVILAVLIPIGYFWFTKVDKHLANGEKCLIDTECASKNCYGGACRGVHDHSLGAGSRCVKGSECASGTCRSDVCW